MAKKEHSNLNNIQMQGEELRSALANFEALNVKKALNERKDEDKQRQKTLLEIKKLLSDF